MTVPITVPEKAMSLKDLCQRSPELAIATNRGAAILRSLLGV
jgi:hypothetical protein